MSAFVLVAILVVAVAGAGAWDVSRALRIGRRLRGARVVTCPETGHAAGVDIDVAHAVATGLIEHAPSVRLKHCSRWAARGRCQELCLHEAETIANTTRAIVDRALKGRLCTFCRRPIEEPAFLDHYAALRLEDGTTVAWPDIEPERLRHTLAAHAPVCWDCHIAETFRRLYPALVTDRPARLAAPR
jgi:hypothetical protein